MEGELPDWYEEKCMIAIDIQVYNQKENTEKITENKIVIYM